MCPRMHLHRAHSKFPCVPDILVKKYTTADVTAESIGGLQQTNVCPFTFSFKMGKKNSNLASLWGAGIREIWGRTLEDNCDFWYRSQLQLRPPSKVFACRAKLVILQGGLAFHRFSQDIDTSIKEKMRPEFLMHNYRLGWQPSPQ